MNSLVNLRTQDFEEDEYADLKPFSTFSSSSKKEKIFSILIYFKRKNVKFVVEIWRFFIKYFNPTTTSSNYSTNFRKLFLLKKLSILNRSILTLLKILPMNSIKNYNFCEFDYEFIEGDICQTNSQISYTILGTNFQNMSFKNYSDNLGSIKLDVMFMSKTAIFNLEDEIKKSLNLELDYNLEVKRQRVISDYQPQIMFKPPEIELKRTNSKSVESELQLNSFDFNSKYIKIKSEFHKTDSNSSKINIENIYSCKGKKLKISPKVSEVTTTATNQSFNHDFEENEWTFENIKKSNDNNKISECKFIKKNDIEFNFEKNFNDFSDPFITNEVMVSKMNYIKYIQTKYNNLDSVEIVKNENSFIEEINNLDYSFVSSTNSELLEISSCENYSDYELKELEESGFLEEINKSYIDQVICNSCVNHNDTLEVQKIILSFSKIKSIIQENILSFNLNKFANLKFLDINSLKLSSEKNN